MIRYCFDTADDITVASPAKSPKAAAAAKSPAENGAKKVGRGRPAGKIVKKSPAKPAKSPARSAGRGKPKKDGE